MSTVLIESRFIPISSTCFTFNGFLFVRAKSKASSVFKSCMLRIGKLDWKLLIFSTKKLLWTSHIRSWENIIQRQDLIQLNHIYTHPTFCHVFFSMWKHKPDDVRFGTKMELFEKHLAFWPKHLKNLRILPFSKSTDQVWSSFNAWC